MHQIKMIFLALSISTVSAMAVADDIKMGIILGFTGPIESLTPDMANSAELAWKEASDSGVLLGGKKIKSVRVDSTCVDAAVASANAERLISAEKVTAIFGADCSGVTIAVANNVAVPNGVVLASPSATSPALSDIEDKGYFFRTAPSDARQGQILADILKDRGVKKVAVTYTNNDYGKGLNQSFSSAFKKQGGRIVIVTAHEDGKADYSAEIAAMAAAGADHLVVFGYLDKGGKAIIQTAIDTDAFSNFILADGMIGQSLVDAIGKDLNGAIGTLPGSDSEGAKQFLKLAEKNGFSGSGPFRAESYDAGALIALAMQAAGSASRKGIRDNMLAVANAPGTKIYPGELAKGLKILSQGGEIDYVGASNVEFNSIGEVYGSYKELVVKDGKFDTVRIR